MLRLDKATAFAVTSCALEKHRQPDGHWKWIALVCAGLLAFVLSASNPASALEVDVTNHNAKTWFDQAANFHSPGARMVERFTLIDPDTIHYQVRIEDASVYTQPWTMAMPLRRNKEKGFRLLEEACHEGERNTDPLIRAVQKIYPCVKI